MDLYTLGIDVGSTASKCVILKNGTDLVAKSLVDVGAGTSGPQRAIQAVLQNAGMERGDLAFALATGYGRNSLQGIADKQMSELSCHARGADFCFPGVRTVIDIGGQDVKTQTPYIVLDDINEINALPDGVEKERRLAAIAPIKQMQIPMPDFVLCCNNICNCMTKWYENIARMHNIPLVMMLALAKQFAAIDYDVLLYDPQSAKNRRGEFVARLVKDSGAQGLVLFMQQFCDPEEMEYPYLKKALDDAGIPHIKIGIDQQMRDFGQARTALQAFADVLSMS